MHLNLFLDVRKQTLASYSNFQHIYLLFRTNLIVQFGLKDQHSNSFYSSNKRLKVQTEIETILVKHNDRNQLVTSLQRKIECKICIVQMQSN